MTTTGSDDRRQIGGERDGVGRPGESRSRPLVLVVSESETVGGAYAGLLWYNGYDVCHVAAPDLAVSLVLERAPDLVLIDGAGADPGPSLDVVRRIRGDDLGPSAVVLVGHPWPGADEDARAAGIDAVLDSPASPFAVVRTVMRLIGAPPPPGEPS